MSIDNESDLYSFETVRQDVITVNGHKYSSPSICLLCISYKTTSFPKNILKLSLGRVL